VKSIVNDFGLFQIEDGYFGSKSIERRIDERNNKSAKARESAYKRWNNANAMPTQCEGNAIKERKGKEKKGEENKEKEIIFTDEFCNFWNLYDKKVGDKEKIFKKWQKLPHAVKEKIFQTLPAFVKAHPDKQYRPNPETYLNNKRWNDEIYSKKEGYKVPTI
jgi:hypothetical protein